MVKRLPAMQETWVLSLGWEDLLEKEMATHTSTLTWRIPQTEEPGRLQSMDSHRVGQDWVTSLSLFTISKGLLRWLSGKESACQCKRCGFNPWSRKIPWRRTWQPTPVFLPGKSHGQRSLAGYSPWTRKEWDTALWLNNNVGQWKIEILMGNPETVWPHLIFPKIKSMSTYQASLVAQLVKNPPAMQETWVQSLGWEDPLEKGKATHSSILAWRIPWTV